MFVCIFRSIPDVTDEDVLMTAVLAFSTGVYVSVRVGGREEERGREGVKTHCYNLNGYVLWR